MRMNIRITSFISEGTLYFVKSGKMNEISISENRVYEQGIK